MLTRALLILFTAAAFAAKVVVDQPALKAKIDKVLATGQDYSFETDVAKHLGIEESLAAKTVKVSAEQAGDGLSHQFFVVMHNGKPFRVILWTTKEESGRQLSEAYAAQTNGRLRRAIAQWPGALADLKLGDVKAAYQHELDFWLSPKR